MLLWTLRDRSPKESCSGLAWGRTQHSETSIVIVHSVYQAFERYRSGFYSSMTLMYRPQASAAKYMGDSETAANLGSCLFQHWQWGQGGGGGGGLTFEMLSA